MFVLVLVAVTLFTNAAEDRTCDSCSVVGSSRAPAIIKVWEEKADNTKGRVLLEEQWIQRDESIPVSSERGRIIYDYKYRSDYAWTTDVHTWCHRGEATKIP